MTDFVISVEGSDVTKTYLTTLLVPVKILLPLVKIVLPNLGPPAFKYPIKPLEVSVGEILILTLPPLFDPDPHDTPSLASSDFGAARSFISGRYPSFAIIPTDNLTHPGLYSLRFFLSDNNPSGRLTSTVEVSLRVKHNSKQKVTIEEEISMAENKT